LMRSIAMPSLSHQTESFERLDRALGPAKGTPLSERPLFAVERPSSGYPVHAVPFSKGWGSR
jgi:hypothetical protein